jgi:hypothetical protein
MNIKNPLNKKVVHYSNETDSYIQLGRPAIVKPIDHPDKERVSSNLPIQTSTVIVVFDDGEFETKNTY